MANQDEESGGPNSSQEVSVDLEVAQAVQSYLNEQEEQRKRWFREQATDSGTCQWKQQLVATLAERWEQQYGEMLRPGDGTEFYPPSKEAHQRQVEDIIKTVLGYLQERPEPPEPGTTVGTYAAEALAYEAMRHLSHLELLAGQGESEALEAYARATRHTVQTLESLQKKWTEPLRKVARSQPNWPVLADAGDHQEINQVLSALEVGRELPFSPEAIAQLKPKAHKKAVRLAMELAVRLEEWRTRAPASIYWYRRMIPPTRAESRAAHLAPFCEQSWPSWFELGWEIVLEENRGNPERNPELRPLGLHREKHSVQQSQQKTLTARTAESNIRDGIRDRLRKAMKLMASGASGK
jgi:hypothetical protein